MGENICKPYADKGLISKLYKEFIQLSKKKESNLKMGRGTEQTFLQRHTNGQQIHEKIPNITSYQRNATQNHNITPYLL